MGNHLCKRKRKADSTGTEVEDNTRTNENDGKAAAEDVLYATIDHQNGDAVGKQVEMDDTCDYATVSIPTINQAPFIQDSTDDYIFMT